MVDSFVIRQRLKPPVSQPHHHLYKKISNFLQFAKLVWPLGDIVLDCIVDGASLFSLPRCAPHVYKAVSVLMYLITPPGMTRNYTMEVVSGDSDPDFVGCLNATIKRPR